MIKYTTLFWPAVETWYTGSNSGSGQKFLLLATPASVWLHNTGWNVFGAVCLRTLEAHKNWRVSLNVFLNILSNLF
jgi:hypothetical protein